MVDAVGTNSYRCTCLGQLESDDGPWPNDTVSYGYTNRLRKSLSLTQPGVAAWGQTYLYDQARRLTNITSPAGAFAYDYRFVTEASPSHLVRKLALPSGAYITNEFDGVSRLLSTRLANAQDTTLNLHAYGYNVGHQRTNTTRADNSSVGYTYDPIGQLKTALGADTGGTNRWLECFGYAYDAAGNVQRITNHALIRSLGVNELNELTNSTRSGYLMVGGFTTLPATNVTVVPNGGSAVAATLYAGNTFARRNVIPANGTNTFIAVAQSASGWSDTNTLTVYLPATVAFRYDLNGNLVSDGLRGFEYDDENQLTRITATNAWKSEFYYDGKMRRRVRREYAWQGDAWTLTNEVRYVYDGNLVLQERDRSNQPLVAFTRGLDLSGSLEGAGGIGGLLARTHHISSINYQPSTNSFYYHADGNGNVTMLINTQQLVVAKYLYEPFGNLIAFSGPLADVNLYRFSSKEFHPNSGLVYYLYRFYVPELRRWANRDPIQEAGGINLYTYSANAMPTRIDPFGLADGDGECPGTTDKTATCYQYACGNYGKWSDWPGARAGKKCGTQHSCDSVISAVTADILAINPNGPAEVPPEGCPPGTHEIAIAVGSHGGVSDYHMFRKTGDTWCHKFEYSPKPSSLDGQGKPITDPANANLNFPQNGKQPASSYQICKKHLCVPDTYK